MDEVMYTGTIVEESLQDNRVLNDCTVLQFKVTAEPDPKDRWHLFTVLVDEIFIEALATNLKPHGWYAHFWHEDDVIAVFPSKLFRFKHSKAETWHEAQEYGKSLGIPIEQLDFLIR